jgi:hypothetical protein
MDVEPANVIPEPVEATYATSKDAIDELFAHAKAHGYCMRLRRSKPDGKDSIKTKYYYECDKEGSDQPRGVGIRQTSSKRTHCDFRVVIRKNQGAWDLEVKNPLHNHGPSLNAAAHHGHRKRDMHTGIFIIHLSTNSRC